MKPYCCASLHGRGYTGCEQEGEGSDRRDLHHDRADKEVKGIQVRGGGVVGQVVGQVGEVLQPARCQLEGQVEHLTYSWRGQGLHVYQLEKMVLENNVKKRESQHHFDYLDLRGSMYFFPFLFF